MTALITTRVSTTGALATRVKILTITPRVSAALNAVATKRPESMPTTFASTPAITTINTTMIGAAM